MKINLETQKDVNDKMIMDYIIPCSEKLIKIHNNFVTEADCAKTGEIMMPLFIFMATILVRIKKDNASIDGVIDEFSGFLKKFFKDCVQIEEIIE